MNQLKAGALLSYVSLVVTNLVGIFYTPVLLRMLGQVEYGLYALVASVVEYLTILDLGFGNAMIRYTAKYRAEGKVEEQQSMFGMFMALYCGVGILAFLIGLGLYFNIENLFNRTMTPQELDQAKIMMMLMIFNVAITFPFSVFGAIITAYENFVFQRIVNIIRVLMQPIVMIVLLFMGYKAIALVVVITVLNILTLSVNTWYCFARLHISIRFNGFEKKLLKEITAYSSLVFIGIIIDRIYWSTGQFILGSLVGMVAVAVYAVAVQLQGYYMSFSSAISGVFLPRVTAMASSGKSDAEFSELFIRVGRIQYAVLGFILYGFIVFGRPFIHFWAGEDYDETYYIALIMMVPLTVPLIQCIGLTILQAKAKLKFRSYAYLIVAIASLGISIPLAKLYGAIGCAAGTSFCLLLGNGIIMNIYYSKRIGLQIGRFWKEIGRMSLPVLGVWGGALCLTLFYPIQSLWVLAGSIMVFSLIYLLVFWRFSMNVYERDLFGGPVKSILKKVGFAK